MSMMQHWTLKITPLSPVHMGTGQDYSPTDYVIEDGVLYEFDALAAIQVLPAADRRRLNDLLERPPGERMLMEIQSFFYSNRERLIPVSRREVHVNPSVEAFYKERIGQVAQYEASGKAVQNRLEIQRTAWSSATGASILPGSGLKGAIRTALLDHLNQGHRLPPGIRSHQQLQESLLQGTFSKDPLRMVRIGDACLTQNQDFATEVRFALNRKKHPVTGRGGALVQSRAEQQGLYQLLECLPWFVPRVFEGSLSVQERGGVRSDEWPNLSFSLDDIVSACNHFYRAHLKRECRLMKEMGYLDDQWSSWMESLFSGPVGSALEEGRAFLLRAGRHSGAESVTLSGVRSIKIMKGRGEQPDFMDEAKTLWLAANERQAHRQLLPFGWLLVEPCRDESDLPSWPTNLANRDIAIWRRKTEQRKQVLWKILDESQARERERQRLADQEAREATLQEARMAAMSEEERLIEALLTTLAQEGAAGTLSPNSQVASDRVNLLRAALQWESPEWRRQAANAIAETVRLLPWSKKSKPERQRELALLRGD